MMLFFDDNTLMQFARTGIPVLVAFSTYTKLWRNSFSTYYATVFSMAIFFVDNIQQTFFLIFLCILTLNIRALLRPPTDTVLPKRNYKKFNEVKINKQ